MSSLAQKKSRSISENVTWGSESGSRTERSASPYARFLGYDRGEGRAAEINEKKPLR
jgi:hypothetical protein